MQRQRTTQSFSKFGPFTTSASSFAFCALFGEGLRHVVLADLNPLALNSL